VNQMDLYVRIQPNRASPSPTAESSIVCYTTERVLEQLNMAKGDVYTLQAGQLKWAIEIRLAEESSSDLDFLLPGEIFTKLGAVPDQTVTIWRNGQTVHVGPVIGVLVSSRYLELIKKQKPPFGAKKLMQANLDACCITYFYKVQQVDWKSRTVQGYMPRQGDGQDDRPQKISLGSWRPRTCPLPTVFYDRTLGMDAAEEQLVRLHRQRLTEEGKVHFLNHSRLGKWPLHEALTTDPLTAPFLPQTIPYDSFSDVLAMLNRHGYIFLKSSYGYHGHGVLSIEQRSNGYVVSTAKRGCRTFRIKTRRALRPFVLHFVQNKPHVVQQGIHVIQHHGCNTDIRLLLVKDRTGTWREIFTRVRMTKGSFPIINSALAQKVFDYEDFYSDRSAVEGKGLPSSSEIVRQATRIAAAIDRRIGSFGELGIDMDVDKQGKIWLIEANSKPNKCPKPHQAYSKPILPQFLSVFEFAKCLERVNVNE
jgi:hypothetical protein